MASRVAKELAAAEAAADEEKRRRDEVLCHLCSAGQELHALRALKAGASPNAFSGRNRFTALHHAACIQGGLHWILPALLEADASVDAQDINGETALHAACYHGRSWVAVRELLEAGASVNIKSKLGMTPLHIAASLSGLSPGKTAKILMLMANGAPLGAYNSHGLTPMEQARCRGNKEAVVLIRAVQFSRRMLWRGAELKWRCWVVAMREELDVEAFLPAAHIRLLRAWAAAHPWALLENPALY